MICKYNFKDFSHFWLEFVTALKYDDEKDILYEDDVFYYPQESKHR